MRSHRRRARQRIAWRRRGPAWRTHALGLPGPVHALPRDHWTKLRSTNPLERVNREIGRSSDVVGIFPSDASVVRLAGALLIEQNDECLVTRRYLSAESRALILNADPTGEVPIEKEEMEVIELNPA